MYLKTFESTKATFVTFDLLRDRIQAVIESSVVLQLLKSVGLSKFIIRTKFQSYDVTTETGKEEFEKVVVRRRPLAICLNIASAATDHWTFLLGLLILLVALLFKYL